MTTPKQKAEELLARVEHAAQVRYKASERLALRQKLSLWTLMVLALTLVLVLLLQALGIQVGIPEPYLAATEAVMGVLVLIYAVLIGQEKLGVQVQAMHHSAVELERLASKFAARDPQRMTDAEYASFAKEHFDIVERGAQLQTVDTLATGLAARPEASKDWLAYLCTWLRVRLTSLFNNLHYIASLCIAAYVFAHVLGWLPSRIETTDVGLQFSQQLPRAALDDDAGIRPLSKRR